MRIFSPLAAATMTALLATSTVPPTYAQTRNTHDAKSAVSASDQQLMAEFAQANMAEVAVAQLAQSKSSNSQIRKFAQQMIDDHGKAFKDLSELAEEKQVKLPKEADAKHKEMLKKMNMLNGAEFDRQYTAKAGIEDHESAKKLVDRIANTAQDPQLKALGTKAQPIIDMHLKMAKELKP
jgi:putative membrane protein